MLRDDMKKYTELTGEDGTHVPIIKLGAYLDGYEKGTEVLDKIKAEIEHMLPCSKETLSMKLGVLEIIDKYKAEGSDKE